MTKGNTGQPDFEDDFVILEPQGLPSRPKSQDEKNTNRTKLAIELQNINLQSKEVLISIQPPTKPQQDVPHTPCDIVLTIDVSGSMQTIAELPDTADANGTKESSGLTILDLVKHASRTILEKLNESDRLAVVAFSSRSRVIQGFVPMTSSGKKGTWDRINALKVQDSTNLWAGIKESLDLFATTQSIGNVQGVYILTDGIPNYMNPAQGFCNKLQPILKTLSANKGPSPTISTFGFGYSLKSSLLRSIAEVGRGYYSFIPDVGMIGTVFVHAVANLFSTFATDLELILESTDPAAKIQTPSYLESKTEKSAERTVLNLGNIRYGQSRDTIVKLDNASVCCSLKATLKYKVPRVSKITVTVEHSLNANSTISKMMIDYQISRHEVCEFLCSLSSKSSQNEHVALPAGHMHGRQFALQKLVSTIESRLTSSPSVDNADLAALLLDLKSEDPSDPHGTGQISLALQTDSPSADPAAGVTQVASRPCRNSAPSPPPYRPPPQSFYMRWGQHYLPSILHAHSLQLCNTFKDPGPLRYGINSPLFIKCREELDDAFDRLPPPQPTSMPEAEKAAYQRWTSAASSDPNSRGSMSRFHSRSNPCFLGSCLVKLANGSLLRVEQVRPGHMLWAKQGGRTVTEVVRTDVRDIEICEVMSDEGNPGSVGGSDSSQLWITPWHPVHIQGSWQFPEHVAVEKMMLRFGSIYSFVLESRGDDGPDAHTVMVGGVLCVTLGHGKTGGGQANGVHWQDKKIDEDAREHPFFGSHRAIMNSLKRLDRDADGRRLCGGVGKGQDGLAIEFLRHDEQVEL